METLKDSPNVNKEQKDEREKQLRLQELSKKYAKRGVPTVSVADYVGLNSPLPDIEKLTLSVSPKHKCLNKYILKEPEFLPVEPAKNRQLSSKQETNDTDDEDDEKLVVPEMKLRSIMRPSKTWLNQEILIENTTGVLTEDIWEFLLKTNKGADGTIKIGKSIFKVHMVCLRIFCKYFLNYPYTVNFQFDPDVVPADGFESAYDWMRLDEFYLPACDIVNALQVATQLKITEFEKDLWRILMDDVFYDEYAYYIFRQALDFETMKPLCHLMLGRLHRYLLLLVSKKNFSMIDGELMETMISSDFCGVNSEAEIFYTVLFWINSDFKKNNFYLEKLMKFVRFGYMEYVLLQDLLECFKNETKINKISKQSNRALVMFFQIKENVTLLRQAMAFTRMRSVLPTDVLIKECKMGRMPYYNKRYYVSDPFCWYHLEPRECEYPMYDDFMNYLEKMETRSDKYPLHMRSSLDDKYLKPTEGKVNMAVKKPSFSVKKTKVDVSKKTNIS